MTRFHKMHGLGNDFVILDAREGAVAMDAARARAIADRRTGVGCDQVILLEPSDVADVRMRIWNADGGEVEACGNATRCVALLEAASATIETEGRHPARGDAGGDRHGRARASAGTRSRSLMRWTPRRCRSAGRICRSRPRSMSAIRTSSSSSTTPTRSIWRGSGPLIEHDPLFPERVNVNVASFEGDAIRLRVWERGAGLTPACGTGACATAVAAIRAAAGRRARSRCGCPAAR